MQIEKIKPLGNRFLVRVDGGPVTIGLIHMPESANLKPQTGTVVAVSPTIKEALKVGDRVQFLGYRGYEFKTEAEDGGPGPTYLLMSLSDGPDSVDDILGVLDGAA